MTPEKKTTKKPKEENPLLLNTEVIGGNWRHRKLGKIIKVTKTLLTVEWDFGGLGTTKSFYSRKGKSFVGRADENGEAITTRNGEPLEEIWDEEDTLELVTEHAKAKILRERADKEKHKKEQEEKQRQIEANPAFVQRQADLKRYAEMLQGLGANIENGWNDQKDFRIELDGIKPEKMDALVEAIQGALR
jgi:hypothetical protein